MRRLLIVIILLGFVLPAPLCAADQTWPEVAADVAAEQRQTRAQVAEVGQQIDAKRKELKLALAEIRRKTAATKARAAALEQRFTGLQKQEDELEVLLEGKKGLLEQIERTFRTNGELLLAGRSQLVPSATAQADLDMLADIVTQNTFPDEKDIALLNQTLLSAIAASGRIEQEQGLIFTRSGASVEAELTHLGNFQSFYRHNDDSGYLYPDPQQTGLQVAAYHPEADQQAMISAAFSAPADVLRLPLDLSSGSYLRTPPEKEGITRFTQRGGLFVWPILAIAVIAALLVLERGISLFRMRINGKAAVAGQTELLQREARTPAEAVVKALVEVRDESLDVRETRLEEAILEQLPRLERFLQTIRIMAAVSPLLGLLGTVSGIIQTFRIISAFGNGDPKLLSGGISEALLTTEAGLMVAIPLLLCHHFLNQRVRAVILDMETAGAALLTEDDGRS